MKLASLRHGRDGKLVVVSRDLTRAIGASDIAPNLQAALDHWARCAPRLASLAEQVEIGSVATFRLREHDCASPLPRAFQRLAAETLGARDGAVPLLRLATSDRFLGARDPIALARDDEHGIDFLASIAIVTDDVPMAVTPEQARAHVALVMVSSEAVLVDHDERDGVSRGDGTLASPATAFSPIAVTPDELGPAWNGARLDLPMLASCDGKPFAGVGTSIGMALDFAHLIALAARLRPLGAGTIVGSGSLASLLAGREPDRRTAGRETGAFPLGRQTAAVLIRHPTPATAALQAGATIRVEMLDAARRSIFGAIEQRIVLAAAPD